VCDQQPQELSSHVSRSANYSNFHLAILLPISCNKIMHFFIEVVPQKSSFIFFGQI
jgi:hypothetical protein